MKQNTPTATFMNDLEAINLLRFHNIIEPVYPTRSLTLNGHNLMIFQIEYPRRTEFFSVISRHIKDQVSISAKSICIISKSRIIIGNHRLKLKRFKGFKNYSDCIQESMKWIQ